MKLPAWFTARSAQSALDRLLGALAPSGCRLCAGPVAARAALCADCLADLPWLDRPCRRCGRPLPAGVGAHCISGCELPPAGPLTRAFAPLAYAYPVDRLVARTKFGRSMAHAHLLGLLLASALARREGDPVPRSAVLVPVPLHWRRLGRRGFNQAGEIARVVADATGLRLRADWLVRPVATPAQSGLAGTARRRNLAGAFRGRPEPGAVVVLVDDVLTTGTTALAAASALVAGGARSVELWAVARALAPGAQPPVAAKL